MHLDDALAFVAADMCLRVHDVLPSLTSLPEISPGKVTDSDHTTWLVKGAKLFTLIKHSKHTLAFCHENSQLYYASPDVALAESCPDNHAFLAQAAEDNIEGRLQPRLLVFDLAHPREDDPKKRGQTLRSLSHVFPPACHVQWVGPHKFLRKFLSNTELPHEVDAVLALRASMQVVRRIGGEPSRKKRKVECS